MAPLQTVTSSGIGVVVSRHDKKGSGEVGESGRGSSQFTGDSDIVLQIHRAEGNARPTIRILDCLSRFEIPDSMVVEWTPTGFVYLGSEKDLGAARASQDLFAVVGPDGALTEKEILDAMPEGTPHTTARAALVQAVADGTVVRLGLGRRGSPYTYARGPEIVSDNYDERFVRNEASGGPL